MSEELAIIAMCNLCLYIHLEAFQIAYIRHHQCGGWLLCFGISNTLHPTPRCISMSIAPFSPYAFQFAFWRRIDWLLVYFTIILHLHVRHLTIRHHIVFVTYWACRSKRAKCGSAWCNHRLRILDGGQLQRTIGFIAMGELCVLCLSCV